jgi:DNA repair protein RadD
MTLSADLFTPRAAGVVLRPYQGEAIETIKTTVRGGVRRIVVEAPTGAGKTKLAAVLGQGSQAKQKRMAFVVPAISLVDQTVEEFYANGIRNIGVIQADHHMTDWSRPIQVCSAQTIEKRGAFPEANSVLFDEIHRLHGIHKRWLRHPDWQHIPMIGLSATPWNKGLGNYFETKITVSTLQELIDQGYLSKFRVFASSHPDLKKVKIVAADYHQGELSGVMQDSSLSADIIRTYKEKWGKGKTLCFAVDKAHALSLQERFNFAGIKCGYQDADTPPDVRRMIRKMFHDGTYEVVVNIDTLTTGVDWDVRCISLCRPTKSEMKYVQIIGRGLRLAAENTAPKDELIILDHSDTTGRLGFVTDIHHEELDTGKVSPKGPKPEKRVKLPVECKKCTALYPPNFERKCPNCGEVNKLQSTLLEADGELVEVKRDGSMWQAAKVKAREWTIEERETFLSELKAYTQAHGYKPGWASLKYKEKFGDWPPREIEHTPAALIISPTVTMWIRSRQIAFAKSKRRQALQAELNTTPGAQ